MRTFKLSISNLKNPVLGRLEDITHPKVGLSIYHFYGGCVADNFNPEKQIWDHFTLEHSYSLKEIENSNFEDEIHIGDIVQFNPSGTSVIVYEKNSKSNALLLTERCNSKCIMCPQPPKINGDNVALSLATMQLIQNDVEVIGITGGEPTLAWDGLIKILNLSNELHPKVTIEILSNGRKFSDYERAKEFSKATNGNVIVCIPLYADVGEIHDLIVNSKGSFWQTIDGIYNLERFNIPIELRIVLLKQNYSRLQAWSDFVYRHFPFIRHVAIMGLEPIGYGYDNLEKIWIDPIDYSKQLEIAVTLFNRRGMNVSVYNHQLCTLPKKIWGNSKESISEWKNIYLANCDNCLVKNDCGGFFESSIVKHSRGIKPVYDNHVKDAIGG